MIYIAHRALYNGPNVEMENHPDQINDALDKGYDCEIDVRLIDGRWMLGHDEPTYQVDDLFLSKAGLWIHCKNLDALANISRIKTSNYRRPVNYFWHQTDDFALTSLGYIWTYPGKPVDGRNGIIVQPEWEEKWLDGVHDMRAAGVCSKFVMTIMEFRSTGAA